MTTPGARRLVRRLPWVAGFPKLVAPLARFVTVAARLGYVARGAVYVSIGAIALLAAIGLTPRAAGAVEALRAWADWPVGVALLWVAGLGLYAFTGWRILQSVFDADRLGASPMAIATRIGKGFSGLVCAGLGVSAFGLLDAMEDLREVDDQATTQAAVERALALPAGDSLVMAVGAVIAAVGVGNVINAFGGHFTASLDCHRDATGWLGALARVGNAARGMAMVPAGIVTILAGWHARASEARGLGGALDMLKAQPFGEILLGTIALGLMAFGAFCFVEARMRRIGC